MRKIVKFLIYLFLSSIFLFGLLLYLWINGRGSEYAKEALNELINLELPDHYSVSYDDINLNIWEKKLTLENFYFSPDSLILPDSLDRTYLLKIPELQINLASVWSIYREKQLIINGITIIDPEILIKQLKLQENPTVTNESLNFFDIITQYLKIFEIAHLDISDANFKYASEAELNRAFILNDINFQLEHFLLDSNLTRTNFFNAKSVELIINKQLFDLPDQIHRLSFDQIRLSTNDSLLSFKNIAIQPLIDFRFVHDLEGVDQHNILYVDIPLLSLNGIDYAHSYLNQDFKMDQLLVEDADIRLLIQEEESPTSNEKGNPISTLLTDFAPNLNIRHIGFINNNIKLQFPQNQEDVSFRIDYLDVYELNLNPEDIYFDASHFPITSFALDISAIHLPITDMDHDLFIDYIELNSADANFNVNQINLQPSETNFSPNKDQFFVKIPQLKVSSLNYFQLLTAPPVSIDQIQIVQPQVEIIQRGSRTEKKAEQQNLLPSNLFKGIHQYFQDIQHLKIESATFKLDDQISIDSVHLFAQQVDFHPKNNAWESLTKNFQLSTENLMYRDSSIYVSLGKLNTNGRNHSFTGLKANVHTDVVQLNVELPQFRLKGTNLDSLARRNFEFDSLLLQNPDLKLTLLPNENSNTTKNRDSTDLPFKTPYLAINNAEIDLHFPSDNHVQMSSLSTVLALDSTWHIKQLNTASNQINLDQFPYLIDIAAIDKIKEDQESYDLGGIAFSAKQGSADTSLHFKLGQLKFESLDRNALLDNQVFQLKKLELDQLELAILPGDNTDSTGSRKEPFSLPAIQLDTLILNSNEFKFAQDSLQLSIPDFKVWASNISTKKEPFEWKNLASYFGNLEFSNQSGLVYNTPRLSTHLDNIDLNVDNQLLNLGPVTLSQQTNNQRTNVQIAALSISNWDLKELSEEKGPKLDISLHQPHIEHLSKENALLIQPHQIEISQFNVYDYFQNESVVAEDVSISDVEVEWKIIGSKAEKGKDKSSNDDFKMPSVNLSSFHLNQANLLLFEDQLYRFDSIQFSLNRVQLDSTFEIKNLSSYYEDAALKVSNVEFEIGKYDEYRLNTGFEYQAKLQLIQLPSIHLTPKYTKNAYSKILEEQSDYFGLSIDSLQIHSFKPENITNQPFSLSKIKLIGTNLEVYRDKNVPRVDGYRPLVQKQLQSISSDFKVDTFQFIGKIRYSELPVDSHEPGNLLFDEVDATITNVTNIKEFTNTPMILQANGKIYGTGSFNAQVEFDLQDSLNGFLLSTVLGPMDVTSLNQMLLPTARLQINKGINKKLAFNMAANEHVAVGEMTFHYNRLNFQIMNKSDIHKTNLGNSILTFWANRLVRSNNPSLFSKQKGIIYFERDTTRAIFNYWSKSILSGVVSSIGIKSNKRKLKQLDFEEMGDLDYQSLFGKKK